MFLQVIFANGETEYVEPPILVYQGGSDPIVRSDTTPEALRIMARERTVGVGGKDGRSILFKPFQRLAWVDKMPPSTPKEAFIEQTSRPRGRPRSAV